MGTLNQPVRKDAITSPPLEKARQLGLSLPLDSERLAILRGCDYYQRDLGPRDSPLVQVPFSNAELAIALVLPAVRPSAHEVRLDLLPEVETDVGRLPHPTRFVEMTGMDRGRVGIITRWIRPRHPFPV